MTQIDEHNDPADQDRETGLVDQVPEDLKQQDQNSLLMGLLADPEVQAVMTARQRGDNVSVVNQEELVNTDAEDQAAEEQRKELEEMDPEVRRVIEIMEAKFKQTVDPLQQEVQSLRSIAASYERQGIDREITDVMTKHKDFKTYQPAMSKLVNEVQGLNVEELYILAKHRNGKLDLVKPSTDSERPTPTPRRSMSRDIKEPAPLGRRGFQEILRGGFERLEKQSQE